jgi:hypothetical protein
MHKVPLHTIVTHRDGQRVEAKPGKPFDFTEEEIEHLEQTPGVLRDLVQERGDVIPASAGGPREDSDETDNTNRGGRRPAARPAGRGRAAADDL